MHRIKYSAVALLLALTACDDSFNGGVSPNATPDKNASNTEVTEKDEKGIISASVTDPLYSLIQEGGATRGVGAFDGWDVSKDKWLNSHMSVFAFRADNHITKGVETYAYDADPNNCLLWNEDAHVVSNGMLDFYNGPKYYNAVHQDYRYKFYVSHIDDAYASDLKVDGKTLKKEIQVDGSQDVMVGFAYHSDSAITKHLTDLVNHGYATDEEVRVLNIQRQNLVYSTTAGHRALHPLFHLRHLMTRFQIQVAGRCSATEPNVPTYRNILITGIELLAPDGGVITIANDAWNEQFDSIPYQEVFALNNQKVYFQGKINTQVPIAADAETDLTPEQATMEREQLLKILRNEGVVVNEPVWQCNGRKPQTLSQDFLVPLQESYKIRLRYYYIDRQQDGKGGFLPSIASPKDIHDFTKGENVTTYEIKPSAETSFKAFQEGKKYIIQLFVYGLEEVKLNVMDLDLWQEGGTIPVEPEEE